MGQSESKGKLMIFQLFEERIGQENTICLLREQIKIQMDEINNLKDRVAKIRGLRNRKLTRMESEIKNLHHEFQIQKRWKSNQILKILIKNYQKVFHYTKNWGFYQWKNIKYLRYIETFANASVPEDFFLLEINTAEAELLISQENRETCEANPLFRIVSGQSALKKIPIKQLFRLFEEIISSKYVKDRKDIDEGFRPRTFPEFFVSYLTEKHNSEYSVTRILSQIVAGLESHSQNSRYITLIRKFLQVKGVVPIGYSLGLFLTKLCHDFQSFVEQKSKLTEGEPVLLKTSEGGNAFLSDVFKLISEVFPRLKLRTFLINLLRPQCLSKEEYLLFYICFMLNQHNLSPEEFFDIVDKDEELVLYAGDIIKGIIEHLEIWIPSESFLIVYSSLDCLNSDGISREQFVNKVNMKTFEKNLQSQRYIVSKCSFVEAVIEVYTQAKLKATAFYLKIFDCNGADFLRLEKFEKIIRNIDLKLSRSQILRIFNEGTEGKNGTKGIDREGFVKTMLENFVGDKCLILFCKRYLAVPLAIS